MAQQKTGKELLLALLHRRRWLAAGAFGAIAVVTVTGVVFLPARYASSATILVENQQVPERFVGSSFTGELNPHLQRMTQKILSRSSLAGVVERYSLYKDLREKRSEHEVVDFFRTNIKIAVADPKSDPQRAQSAFTITYTGERADAVAHVVNELASMYVQEDLGSRERQASGTTEFLKTQLAEMKRKLDEQEAALKEFQETNAAPLKPAEESQTTLLERLRVQLMVNAEKQAQAKERKKGLERRIAAIGDAAPTSGGDPDMAIARVEQEYRELRGMRDEIAAAGSEIDRLEAEAKQIEDSVAEAQKRLKEQPEREQRLKLLQRDYDTTQELYQSMLKRYEEARVAENLEHHQKGEQFRVLDPGVVPDRPAGPKRWRLLFLGLALSLAAAVGAVFVAEQLDDSFHTTDDLRHFSKVPVLVTVAKMPTREEEQRERRRLWIDTAALATGLPLLAVITYFVVHDNHLLVTFFS